jgi:hypothetical protein
MIRNGSQPEIAAPSVSEPTFRPFTEPLPETVRPSTPLVTILPYGAQANFPPAITDFPANRRRFQLE